MDSLQSLPATFLAIFLKGAKQQQRTSITSKIYVHFKKKKLNNKVKIASGKTETEQNNLCFTRKDMGPVPRLEYIQLDLK